MKPYSFVLSLLVALLLVLGNAPARTHAQSAAPEPTTCLHTPQEIAGRMTLDADHDALPDPDEGVPGITFILANVQSGTTVLQTVTTDLEGCYRFNRSLVVNGQLHRVSWSGMHPTTRLIHDPDNGATAGSPNFLFIGGAGQPLESDVVYRSTSVPPYMTHCPYTDSSTDDVGGMVALDLNHNNRADPGEGIPGAVVTFAVANPTQVIAQAITDANGCYRLERQDRATADIQGCCNHLQLGETPAGIQGCCNHRAPETTYMYLRAYLPEQYGGVAPSYDPNGRQTENAFYEIFTTPNGNFETDFLLRDFSPTAVTVSTFGVAPVSSHWMTFTLSLLLFCIGAWWLFRRRNPLS